jgi:DNA-directed RNA polymerase specialized sigma24 family protein
VEDAAEVAETASDVVDGLPEAYALALRLQVEGLDDAAIGRVLAIEEESVAPLLTLARAKLAKLEGRLAPAPGLDTDVDGGRNER